MNTTTHIRIRIYIRIDRMTEHHRHQTHDGLYHSIANGFHTTVKSQRV